MKTSIFQILSFVLTACIPCKQVSAQGVIIPSGIYLIQENGNLVNTQNWTNNGSFTANGGTVIFDGSTQTIGGTTPTVFNNLSIATGSTTSIDAAGQQLKGILKSDGTLNADGNLSLLSTATQTALIDGEGTGDVLGNVIIQRYLADGNGYKYLSSPFEAATVNEFADDIDLNATFPLFYNYDENDAAKGWLIYTNPAGVLTPALGYTGNFGTSATPKTIDMTGVVNNGTISAGTLYNHNQPYTAGFNLVGNPYPSPIDWQAVSGWTRTGLDDAIYYFNTSEFQYTGHYSSFINGVSSDGIANGIIPAMQGFFVHVSDGSYPTSASFSMTNDVRINDLNPLYHKTNGSDVPLLRLHAGLGNDTTLSDALAIYFDANSTTRYDKKLDALKLFNTDENVPNIYTISPDSGKLSINAMPYPGDEMVTIPLGLALGKEGMFHIKATTLEAMPYGLHVYLADENTKTIKELHCNTTYNSLFTAGQHDRRLSIIFSKKELPYNALAYNGLHAFFRNNRLFVHLNLETGSEGRLVVRDVVGREIYKTDMQGYGEHPVDVTCADGVYVLSFYSYKGIFSQKMLLGSQR